MMETEQESGWSLVPLVSWISQEPATADDLPIEQLNWSKQVVASCAFWLTLATHSTFSESQTTAVPLMAFDEHRGSDSRKRPSVAELKGQFLTAQLTY